MAKNQTETEITVISCFDGEQDAAEVFARLFAERMRNALDSPIASAPPVVYNENKVHHPSSGLCG